MNIQFNTLHNSYSTYLLPLQLKVCPKRLCISTVGVRRDLFRRDPDKVLITDFFGAVRPVEVVHPIDTHWPHETILSPNRRFVFQFYLIECIFLSMLSQLFGSIMTQG